MEKRQSGWGGRICWYTNPAAMARGHTGGDSAQVPEATLAQLRDHRREPRGGVAPIRLGRDLSRARIARRDAADDRVVLLHRRRQLVEEHADVEPRISLALRLDHPVEREEPRAHDPLDVG